MPNPLGLSGEPSFHQSPNCQALIFRQTHVISMFDNANCVGKRVKTQLFELFFKVWR